MESNPYAEAARQKKAFALAARLHQHAITADEAELMTEEQWYALALVCEVRSPSGETQKMVIEALRQMERPKLSPEEVARAFRRCGA